MCLKVSWLKDLRFPIAKFHGSSTLQGFVDQNQAFIGHLGCGDMFLWFQWHSSNLGPFWGELLVYGPGSSKWPFWRFQVTFSGVNMVKCPAFGWSKGHLEEAGRKKKTCFRNQMFFVRTIPSLVNDGSQWNGDSMVAFVYQHVNVTLSRLTILFLVLNLRSPKSVLRFTKWNSLRTSSIYLKLLLVSSCRLRLVKSAAGQVFVSLESIFLWKVI